MSAILYGDRQFDIDILGKNINEAFTCLICGHTLSPQKIEQPTKAFSWWDNNCFDDSRDVINYSPQLCETRVDFTCGYCGSRVELSIPDSAQCVVGSKPSEPLEWEYIVMAIHVVKYGRVKNLDNGEVEKVEAEAVISDGQTPGEALADARRFVKDQLGLGPTSDDIDAALKTLEDAGIDVGE